MNVVADTHAWVWWILRSDSLSSVARDSLQSANQVFLSAISLWETVMLIEKGRIPIQESARDFLEQALAEGRIEVVPVSIAIAARCGELGPSMRGHPADRLIAATALELGVPLVTRDERLARIDGLRTIW